jgi:hypothetical protein
MKRGAKRRGIPFEIGKKYVWELFVKQYKRCALTGIEITFPTNIRRASGTASLDRINNAKGYVEENVQWVHKTINDMKGRLTDEEFIKYCLIVAEYQKERKEKNGN